MGVWLPVYEQHMSAWMEHRDHIVNGRGTYQYHKYEQALALCKERTYAIDVGAHCGLWSMHMVNDFDHLIAFEPVPLHCEAFKRNVERNTYTLHAHALGGSAGELLLSFDETNTGDTHVTSGHGLVVRVEQFDELYPDLENVGFVKLDCEGYEYFALKGMERMLQRCKPVVLVEQKPNRATRYGLEQTQAVDYLRSLGAMLVAEISGDYLLQW